MSRRRLVILGYDAVSPLGTELAAQWLAAAAGRSGVGVISRFAPPPGFPVEVAGQVPAFDPAPYPCLSPRAMAHWTSPVFAHALLVVHRALIRAGLPTIPPALSPRVAVTFGTAIGGLDAVLAADRLMIARGQLPKPFVNPNACVNMVTGKVAILAGATGPVLTPITACATGSTSLALAGLLLEAGAADVAITGAVDFPLVEPILAGFATMNGAYRRRPEEPLHPEGCSRPFSADRRGFVVAEGAACLILATAEFATAQGLPWEFELAGWCMNGDADHFVAPRLETVTRCMVEALAHAGVTPGEIDVVNAHATSTKVGDQIEAEALRTVFGDRLPGLTANKSLFGHAMGASSALETVLALEGMRHGLLLPTRNLQPDPALGLTGLVTAATPFPQQLVLKNAFGFGGANCCTVLRRVAPADQGAVQ